MKTETEIWGCYTAGLEMNEGTTQGMQEWRQLLEAGKGKKIGSPLEPMKNKPCQNLEFRQVKLISDFWTTEL